MIAIKVTGLVGQRVASVKVDGSLAGLGVPELRRACEGLELPFVIELTDLHFADAAGLCLLRDLRARGATLANARPFIEMALAAADEGDTPAHGGFGHD